MNNQKNLQIYRLWSSVYDVLIPPLYGRARQQAVALLQLEPGERLLIPGIGTGLDLAHIPLSIPVVGTDISPEMLRQAQPKALDLDVVLLEMDAQALAFAEASFDAVLLNLILTVVPDGRVAFNEAWRLLRPGGRAVIFDKFLPAGDRLTPFRRMLGRVLSLLGTDPNRRFSDIVEQRPDLSIVYDEPSLLGGQYRSVVVTKAGF